MVQGRGLRDQAQTFEDLSCSILGISFDTPEENKAFKEKFDFPYPLLSDHGEQAGVAYEVRQPGDEKVHFAMRHAYLIDPEGIIRKAYDVKDVEGFATNVADDLRSLQG